MSRTRVRFAPSPTGFFHIGSARTALFNWLYAKHTGGAFILRIEDTDQQRNTAESLAVIFDGMRWLGLDWDEGPEKGGDFGPYFQSQRADIYRNYLEELRKKDRVYEKDGAIYFKISNQPQTIEDCVRGTVTRSEEKDFVIFRSDNTPVFHFVNVVDDIAMQITHIIRGEDHLSNTSKHVELFKAFGAPLPAFAHIPLILKSNGAGKMSKRDQGALVEEYKHHHYLPEAVRNYLCLLGWSPKDNREILPIEEIIQLFDLPAINKNNARFDETKMAFMNTAYVRALPQERFIELAKPILAKKVPLEGFSDDYIHQVLAISQEKIRSLKEIPAFVGHFFQGTLDFKEIASHSKPIADQALRLNEILQALQNSDTFTEETLEQCVKALAKEHTVPTGHYIHTTRFATSGQESGPGFYKLLKVLGKQRVIDRIQKFLSVI